MMPEALLCLVLGALCRDVEGAISRALNTIMEASRVTSILESTGVLGNDISPNIGTRSIVLL